ncbi:AMP-binding protein [Streptomyces sp. NPDC058662]|uniref:AMP-binding protein n=1 Tax=Streptomyces sp. NPDC058662 TaxID=3346583 RepID=UPI003662BD90
MPSRRLVDALASHERSRPGSAALVLAERTVTYGELAARAEELGTALNALELGRDQPLCIPAHKTPETVALLLAAFRAGYAVLAPSPDLGSGSLETLCAQARCSQVLTADHDGLHASALAPDPKAAEGFDAVDPDRVKLLLTTSGSTGTPKIVPIAAAAFDNFADWAVERFELTSSGTALSYAPLNFDLSLLDLWTFLLLGARVVLVEPALSTDPRHLRKLLTTYDIDFIQGVPMLFRLLTQDGADTPDTAGGAQPAAAYPRARTVIFTGDAVPPMLLRDIGRAFPDARFHNVFGCTETNDSFIHDVVPATAGPRIPIGRPVAGARALILDDGGKVVEGPGTGELLVTTPFQTFGYLQLSRNADVFVPAPDGTDAVFYRTGDVVTRDAAGLYFLDGRTDFQIKVRGVRTNLQEVENVLAAHPDVAEAAVVAIPDAEAGYKLHAEVTRVPGTELSSLRLRTHSAKNLPRHAIPSSLTVSDAPLPRTSTGKPDRNHIKHTRQKGKAA